MELPICVRGAGPTSSFEDEYPNLLAIAGRFKRFSSTETVTAMGLVHETWLRLQAAEEDYFDRAHFLSTVSMVMRQIVLDYARRQNRLKRGGDRVRITLHAEELSGPDQEIDMLIVNDALKKLEAWDERQARIVELRFFVGLSNEETAEVLKISERTVKREWTMARAWLQKELG